VREYYLKNREARLAYNRERNLRRKARAQGEPVADGR